MRGRDLEGSLCILCGVPVTLDEAAVTRKLINRGTVGFYCTDCLALRFRVDRRVILDKIAQFREDGCTLFEKEP